MQPLSNTFIAWVARVLKGVARYSVDSRGGIAIEFAILLPVVLTIVAGTVQYGNVLYVRQIMAQAAEEAARSYAYDSTAAEDAKQIAQNRLADTGLTYTIVLAEPASGETNVKVSISTPMQEAALVNALGRLMDGNIEVSVIQRMASSDCDTESDDDEEESPPPDDTEMSTDCTIGSPEVVDE